MKSAHFLTQNNPALAHYLALATFGLAQGHKQEIWNELEEHILTRADHLELQGVPPSQAITRALSEMGSPILVSASMNKVHNMPKLIAFASLTAITLSASFYAAASSGNAVVLESKALRPSECQGSSCIETTSDGNYKGVYFNLKKMKPVFDKLDVKMTDMRDGQWRLATKDKTIDIKPAFSKDGKPYVKGDLLLNYHVMNSNKTRLKGFHNPSLEVKGLSIQLKGDGPRIFNKFSKPLVSHFFPKDNPPKDLIIVPRIGDLKHTIQTKYAAGEVIMLVERHFTKCADKTNDCTPKSAYMVSFSEVQPGGIVHFKSEYQTMTFKSTHEDLSLATNSREGNALLVKVTNVPLNNLGASAFVPREAVSAAGK